MLYPINYHCRTTYLIALTAFTAGSLYALDENANGLSDVWEQRFNASDLALEDDDDGDNFTNLEECIAGTDPYDAQDHPRLFPSVTNQTGVELQLDFDTLRGKSYTIIHSGDLSSFAEVPPSWPGDNHTRSLKIKYDVPSGSRGRWIPTTSVDQFAAVMANWFGVPIGSTEMATIFPNLGRFDSPFLAPANLGFLPHIV